MAVHRRRTWFLTRWTKRQQEAALDAAAAAEEMERRAAVRRVLEQATELLPVVRPARPLLTPGQAARTRRVAP